MVDFGHESHFGSCHRILFWKKQFKFKSPSLKRRVLRACDDHMEVARVPLVGRGRDAGNGLCHQPLCLLSAGGNREAVVRAKNRKRRSGCFSLRSITWPPDRTWTSRKCGGGWIWRDLEQESKGFILHSLLLLSLHIKPELNQEVIVMTEAPYWTFNHTQPV